MTHIETGMSNRYTISTDKALLDVSRIYDFLASSSYWGRDRSSETVRTSIEHSLCFGVYHGQELVGFARVVTDYAIFAWLCDVFVIEAHRKEGIGKALMATILNCPELGKVKRWMLGTRDAHGLYKHYGFRQLKDPDMFMERINSVAG